jgi:hypothetical protein
MGHAAGLRQPFLPALGRVFATGRETAFTAAGGSLGSRDPVLLVSVSALPARISHDPGQPLAISGTIVESVFD